jgi:hypothetical protein
MKKSDKMRLLLESLKNTGFFSRKKKKEVKTKQKPQVTEEKQENIENKVIRKRIVKKRN